MGGLLMVISIIVPTLFWVESEQPVHLDRAAGVGGLWRHRLFRRLYESREEAQPGPDGTAEVLGSGGCGHVGRFLLLLLHANQAYSTAINVPFLKQFHPDLLIEPLTKSFWTYPLAFVPFYMFIVLIMVGSSNAVNLTDGLDGLATGLMIIASGAMTALTYVSSHAEISRYLGLARTAEFAGADDLLRIDGRRDTGISWYNCHPAEVFMGDVGSLALGGGLG